MRSDNENIQASMADIGERLKSAREKKSLTIDQARKQTRIHSTVLTALEEGRCDDLLTPTYVRSFLKIYAEFLGLDSKIFLKDYSLLHPGTNNRGLEMPGTKDAVDLSGLVYVLKSVLVAAVILILILLLGKKTVDYLKPKRPLKPARAPLSRQKAVSVKAAALRAAPQKTIAAPKGTVVPQEGIPKKATLNLEIKVKQPVLVRLKRDGSLMFERVLPKGAVESFTAEDNINIFIAKAEAVELTLNGKQLSSLGNGVIRDLEITRRGVRVR